MPEIGFGIFVEVAVFVVVVLIFVVLVVAIVVTGFTGRWRMIEGVVSALARLQHNTSSPSGASLQSQWDTCMWIYVSVFSW